MTSSYMKIDLLLSHWNYNYVICCIYNVLTLVMIIFTFQVFTKTDTQITLSWILDGLITKRSNETIEMKLWNDQNTRYLVCFSVSCFMLLFFFLNRGLKLTLQRITALFCVYEKNITKNLFHLYIKICLCDLCMQIMCDFTSVWHC